METKEQQNKYWDDLNEESKESHRQFYKAYKDYKTESIHYHVCRQLEKTFGIHNLVPRSQIRTWEDVEKKYPNIKSETNTLNYHISTCIAFDDKIDKKLISTYQIAKLIDLGYGGMISREEWENKGIDKYCIERVDGGLVYTRSTVYCFVAFHTPEQRERFWAYETNRELVEQYFMM